MGPCCCPLLVPIPVPIGDPAGSGRALAGPACWGEKETRCLRQGARAGRGIVQGGSLRPSGPCPPHRGGHGAPNRAGAGNRTGVHCCGQSPVPGVRVPSPCPWWSPKFCFSHVNLDFARLLLSVRATGLRVPRVSRAQQQRDEGKTPEWCLCPPASPPLPPIHPQVAAASAKAGARSGGRSCASPTSASATSCAEAWVSSRGCGRFGARHGAVLSEGMGGVSPKAAAQRWVTAVPAEPGGTV